MIAAVILISTATGVCGIAIGYAVAMTVCERRFRRAMQNSASGVRRLQW